MATIIGLDELERECAQTLRVAGVQGRYVQCGAVIGYEYTVPSQQGLLRVRSWVAPMPGIGAHLEGEVGARFRKKLKKKLKKFVKSKAFRALGKVAKGLASAVPGGAALVTAATVAEKAARAIKAAKRARVRGDEVPMQALPRALQIGCAEVRAARAGY